MKEEHRNIRIGGDILTVKTRINKNKQFIIIAFAKGMTNREWIIHEQARCLYYLLSSVIKTLTI